MLYIVFCIITCLSATKDLHPLSASSAVKVHPTGQIYYWHAGSAWHGKHNLLLNIASKQSIATKVLYLYISDDNCNLALNTILVEFYLLPGCNLELKNYPHLALFFH